MFTGLIQSTGEFAGCKNMGKAGKLSILSHKTFENLQKGESIAVNGVCLTLESWSGNLLHFHVLAETFSRTDLGELSGRKTVNLDRALALGDRLGGHIVSGHVDGTGRILSLGRKGSDIILEIAAEEEILSTLVPKGSIAVDGISLTIASIKEKSFTICIIPTTWEETNLHSVSAGDRLNLETDMLGKYVKSLLERSGFLSGKENSVSAGKKKPLGMDDLVNAGFLE